MPTAADFMVNTLKHAGVKRIYGVVPCAVLAGLTGCTCATKRPGRLRPVARRT
jgi:hypothetical protein